MAELHEIYRSAVLLTRDEADKIAEALATFSRISSGAFELLVAKMDRIDGDPDLEVDRIEDDFFPASVFGQIDTGPGCEIADPDCAVDDSPCDAHPENGL